MDEVIANLKIEVKHLNAVNQDLHDELTEVKLKLQNQPAVVTFEDAGQIVANLFDTRGNLMADFRSAMFLFAATGDATDIVKSLQASHADLVRRGEI